MKASTILITASTLIFPSISLAAVGQPPEQQHSVAAPPKWSLPFQGQLGAETPSVTSATVKADNSSSKTCSSISNSTSNSINDGLDLLKPKKYQTLSLTPVLTAEGIVGENVQSTTSNKNNKIISGAVSAWDGPMNVDHIVNHLLDKHFENSPEAQKLNEQVKHLAGLRHKTIDLAKDGLNQSIGYQGFDPSIRAGKLILDSKDYKIRDIAWAEYARQKYIDKIHGQIVTSMMQIAEGIGNDENERGSELIAAGKESLSGLVGEEEAERTVKGMSRWLNSLPPNYGRFAEKPWSTIERNKKLEEVIRTSFERDPVISTATSKIDKYAHVRRWRRISSRVLFVALDGTILFAPGILPGLGAEVIEVGYLLGTGGTEQHKLERELLLDKRIQSRLKVLTQEASMALDNYRYALVTKNPQLLAFSDELINNLTAKPDSTKIVSVPELKESVVERN